MSYSPENNERGFTIIELVFGLAISLILLGVAVKIFLVQQRSYNVQEQLSEMQQNIRSAMDMIVRETKMAGYDPKGTAFSSGIIYDTSQLRILKDDFDIADGTTAGPNEDITYKYYGDPDFQIKRKGSTGGSFQPLADNIIAFDFDYYDADGTSTITSALIRQVQVTITGRTDKTDPDLKRVDGEGYRYGTLTSSVSPENLDF